ncbi:pantetheine-phosphate adenylyltransferase [Calderihabitans maritimus]|uniref:Phosphopantetheine adenylyltransferase n=1 Tax=Calderihabitans maritimus TaxID=1246530 RepID=A0A1Z5HPC6_9FIRM|nr:pantetheine-phosphate adenylyltransferase [Calderihabitans maritimus]GAW91155.1 phosphopantetheine adenylyltransferase [Calderihabitans maritimus]
MRIAVYPGTFDPVTNGHLDIIQRASKLFDRVIIAVAYDNYKNNLFSHAERIELLKKVTQNYPNVEVEGFKGLLANFVKKKGANIIIRGLRAISDFEYEFQLSMMNKKLAEEVETLFLMTAGEYSFLSSSIIKQVASLGGCIKGLVPPEVAEALYDKYGIQRDGDC